VATVNSANIVGPLGVKVPVRVTLATGAFSSVVAARARGCHVPDAPMPRYPGVPIASGNLAGAHAVVTGAAGGIGSAIADALAQAGALVFGLDIAHGNPALTRHAVVAVDCDVTDPESVERAVRTATDSDVLDILIAAAGRFPNRVLEEWTLNQFEALWRLNVGGVFNVVKSALPYLRRSLAGRVVFVSSSAVHQLVPGFAPYAATKAALIGFARSLAAEVASDGVTVNVVTPGLTATSAALGGDVSEFFDGVVARQLLGRRLRTEDLVPGIMYLCSPGAAMVTGQVLNIDGGSIAY
jgi:3-oxoacyl-[acyl-carrier protein] reductase